MRIRSGVGGFLRKLLKEAGPYMLVELLLPGGTLLALLLFISRTGALSALQPTPVAWQPTVSCQVLMEPIGLGDAPCLHLFPRAVLAASARALAP